MRAFRIRAGIAAACGALAGDVLWHVPLGAWLLLGAGSAATGAASRRGTRRWALAGALVALAFLAGARAGSDRAAIERSVAIGLADARADATVVGRVAGEPERKWGRVNVVVKAASVESAGRWYRCSDRLLIEIPAAEMPDGFEIGADVRATGTVVPPPGSSREYLLRKHSAARLLAESVEVLGPAPRYIGATTALRARLSRTALGGMSPEDAGLILGLVYGDTALMPRELERDFRRAGLSHLTAVSGANFAIVLAMIAFAIGSIRSLRERPWAVACTLGLCAGAFVLLTRWEPSVLRAGAMAMLAIVTRAVGGRLSLSELISCGVAIALLGDPMLAFSAGFQLSVAATLGIALMGLRLIELAVVRLRIPRILAAAAGVALSAEVWVAPVLAWRIGAVQPLAFPANVLAFPAAELATAWGLVALVAIPWSGPLAPLLYAITELLTGWIIWVARLFARAGWAELSVGGWPAWAKAGAFGLPILATWATRRASRSSDQAAVWRLGKVDRRAGTGDQQ